METVVAELLQGEWERYQVPDTSVSAEFPAAPWVDQDSDDQDEAPTVALTMDFSSGGVEFQLDLAVADAQSLKVESSKDLVTQLKAQLGEAEGLEVLSVEPRECEGYPGALQRLRLAETGELLAQWLIAVPEGAIFVGVTYLDQALEPVLTRFLDSVSLSVEGS